MTDGSVRGGTNGEIGVWASGNIAFANPVAHILDDRVRKTD